jgi:hypothetical protein
VVLMSIILTTIALKAENNVLIFTGSTVKMSFQVMKRDDAAVLVGATGIGVRKMMILRNVTPCTLAGRYRSIEA